MFASPIGVSQFGGGFVPQPSQLPDGEKQSQFEKSGNQTLRALSFAQILKAIRENPDSVIEDLRVDGHEVTDMKSVCQIIDIQETNAYTQYKVDDTTAQMLVREWKGGQHAAASELYVNKYVEVFGHLRMVDSALCLMAFRIRPLINYNQVFHHQFEIIHQHLMHTKGPLEEDRQVQQENPMQGTPMGGSMYGSATPPTIGDGKDPRFASELQRIFVAGGAINKPHGLHINEIHAQLQHIWSKQDVDRLVQLTLLDGKVYNTAPDTYQWYS